MIRRGPAAAVLATLLAGTASAQAEPDTLPRAELAPIVVEVLRTPIELRRVPFAVAARDAQEMREARPGLALDEALHTVPGVQVDNRYNYALGERISIRGFGARTQFGVRGIRIIADGIPATFADGQSALEWIDPGALDRVEVVRGPAAAAYGNSAGGVILFRSLAPPPVRLAQTLRVVAGDNGLLRLESRTGGRSGTTAYQLRASRLTYEGYREYSEFQTRNLSGQLQQSLGSGELRFTANYVDFEAENPGSLDRALLAQDRFQAFPTNVQQATGKDGRHAQAGAWLRQPLRQLELELSAHAQWRDVLNPIPARIIELDRTAAGTRALLRGRFRSAGRDATWAVGADLDRQRDDRRNFANEQGERGALALDQFETVSAAGGFGQLLLPLADAWELMAGVRADALRFRVRDRFITDTDPDDSGVRSMSALSPSLGIVWSPASAAVLYANVATAFETPTTTELANRPDGAGGFNPNLEPQQTHSVELGLSGEIAPAVAYQFAVYRAALRNALIPFQVPEATGRDFYRNAGSARHSGFEATLAASPLPGLDLRLAHSVIEAVFRSYQVRGVRYDGNRVPGIAPHRTEASATYRMAGGAFVGLDALRVAAVPVHDANEPGTAASAYRLAHIRAGHRALGLGPATLAPFFGVRNVFDTEYVTSVTINAFGARFYEPGPGRALYFGVEAAFGYPRRSSSASGKLRNSSAALSRAPASAAGVTSSPVKTFR